MHGTEGCAGRAIAAAAIAADDRRRSDVQQPASIAVSRFHRRSAVVSVQTKSEERGSAHGRASRHLLAEEPCPTCVNAAAVAIDLRGAHVIFFRFLVNSLN